VSDSSPIADGIDHQLDPRVIPLERITGSIFIGILSVASLIGVGIFLVAGDDVSQFIRILVPILWATLVLFGFWHAYLWPPRSYAHTFYRVDDQGLEIRKGVHWRVVINVPRSRVQHIDVSQGPIDRRYGLGTLVIYTAGTDHAKIELEGLEHGRALRIREHLLPPKLQHAEAGDAV
jgi:membrane protein YdbS with pleckstrin-like domain